MHEMQDMHATADLLTAQQVQRLLDVDKSTVYRMAGDGRLPAVKIGRQWRFPVTQVERLLRTGIPEEPSGARAPAAAGPLGRLNAEVAQAVIDVAATALGVMMVVTDMQGRPTTRVANPCPWFDEHAEDPAVVASCVAEWRELAAGLDFEPRFTVGAVGFACARTFVRSGSELVGMVLAGGLAPDGARSAEGLYHLDAGARAHVLRTLPHIGAALSRLAGHAAAAEATDQGEGA
jgi:excisionase family DNA binding protein